MQTNRRTELGCTSISRLMNHAICNLIAPVPHSMSWCSYNKDILSFLKKKSKINKITSRIYYVTHIK